MICILLTACIAPKGMSQTQLQDEKIRLTQYLNALRYYLKKTTLPIVIVENSGYDISDLFPLEISQRRLEILTFSGNDYDKARGKGYGEALIIQYAMKHSDIVSKCDYLIKITGRLIVENLNYIISDFKCFKKTEIIASYSCPGFLDSRVFIATTHFFEAVFLPKISKLSDDRGFYFEHLLQECKNQVKWRPFLFALPHISGMSGTYGVQIKSDSIWTFNYWRVMKYNWKCWLKKN